MKDPAVGLHMNLEIIVYLCAGVFCAFLPLRFQYLMLFPFLTYGYLHNRRALLFFLFSHVLFLGALSVSTAYLTLLGILIFFLLVQCVRSAHRLSLWLTLINIAMQFPFVIQMQDAAQIIAMMMLLIVLYGEQYEKDAWIRNAWWNNDVWKGTLIVSLYLFCGQLFPEQELIAAVAASLAAAQHARPIRADAAADDAGMRTAFSAAERLGCCCFVPVRSVSKQGAALSGHRCLAASGLAGTGRGRRMLLTFFPSIFRRANAAGPFDAGTR